MFAVFRITTRGIDGVAVGVAVLLGVEDGVAVGENVETSVGVCVALGVTVIVGDGRGGGSGA